MPWIRIFYAAVCTAILTIAASGQHPLSKLGGEPAAKQPAPSSTAVLTNALQQVTREIGQAGTNDTARVRSEKLRQVKRLIEERMAAAENPARAMGHTTEDLPDIPSLAEVAAPYSLELLDALRHARNVRERALQNLQILEDAATDDLEKAQKDQQTHERDVRQLAESKEAVADRQTRLDLLKIDARIAEQQKELSLARLRAIRTSIDALQQEQASIREQIQVVQQEVAFSRAYYDQQMLAIDRREASIKNLLFVANLELHRRQNIAAESKAAVNTLRMIRREIEVLEERLQMAAEAREVWNRRFALYAGEKHSTEFTAWCEEAREQIDRFNRLLRLRRVQYEEAAAQVRDEEDAASTDETRKQLVAVLDSGLAALERNIELNQHLLEDYDSRYGTTFSGALLWSKLRKIGVTIWNFEISTIDDRPITVSKVTYAILLILIGLKLARLFSHSLVNKVLGRFKVEESSISSISTLLFYFFALIVTVIALGVANIPLTLFTLLGGALAIGVGFGSQNILNNFISGLILLVERPIRKGDMVEVGDTHGRVDRVGLRCTRVRTFQNVDILVPNSTFLETNVVNLTLSDDRFKAELFVGVIYGSPTERVRDLILQAATEHEKVLTEPKPEVMFMDFGDSALIFRLYAWVRMRQPSDRDRVLSDLRFRIDELFRAEDLVIAFPQQDVHLDVSRPVEVRLSHTDSEESAS